MLVYTVAFYMSPVIPNHHFSFLPADMAYCRGKGYMKTIKAAQTSFGLSNTLTHAWFKWTAINILQTLGKYDHPFYKHEGNRCTVPSTGRMLEAIPLTYHSAEVWVRLWSQSELGQTPIEPASSCDIGHADQTPWASFSPWLSGDHPPTCGVAEMNGDQQWTEQAFHR